MAVIALTFPVLTVPAVVGQAAIDAYPWDLASVLRPGMNGSPRFVLYRPVAVDGTQPVTVDPATWRAP